MRQSVGAFILIAFLSSLAPAPLAAQDGQETGTTHVLILNSYHPGYPWSDGVLEGMVAALREALDPQLSLSIEYLDSKRKALLPGGSWDRELKKHIAAKYSGRALDLILCSDQAAYDFLRRWRDESFGPVQTVFCGVEDPGAFLPGDRYTGFDSRRDWIGQLGFIESLLPDLNRILILSDGSEPGKINRRALEEALALRSGGPAVSFLDPSGKGLDQDELLHNLGSASRADAVLILDYFMDASGSWVDPSSFIPLLSAESKAPLFYHADFLAGSGIVGGLLADSRHLGSSAAAHAVAVLSGRALPEGYSMPEPTHPVVDAAAARRFGIPTSRFPPGTLILNPSRLLPSWVFLTALMAAIVIALEGLLIAHLVTSRKKLRRMAAEMATLEAETRTIFDSSPVGIVLMRGKSFLRANRRMAEMTGYGKEVFRDTDARFLFADLDEYNRVSDDMAHKLRDTGEALTRASLRKADGQRFDVIIHVNGVAPGDPSQGSVATFLDDTPLRRREEELAQSRKMQVVGQLAGGVAHDFNNLLGGIMGAAEILKLSLPEGSPALSHAQSILNAASRGSDLTRKLLTFSRKGDFRPVPFDMRASIASVTGILERSIDKRIQISIDDAGESAFVLGDQSMVENALLNLALNARDSMPDGGRILFRCRVTENLVLPGREILRLPYRRSAVLVSVSDTGIGMMEDLIGKIFEPFFTTKPLGKGTGLGLAAVYGTMESHLGGLSVESVAGRGSTFHLAFPMEKRVNMEPPVAEADLDISGQGRILVVDDELMVREIMASLLSSLGYTPVVASSGREGLEILKREGETLDAILLDMMMPDMDGRQVYRELRKDYPDTPVVFISGFTGEAHLGDVSGMGAQGFLQKPCGRAELGRLLKRVLGL